jgi:hypothetical protein
MNIVEEESYRAKQAVYGRQAAGDQRRRQEEGEEQMNIAQEAKQAIDRGQGAAMMPTGKSALLERIHQLRFEAEVLQALYNALPERLTSDQSAGLNALLRSK